MRHFFFVISFFFSLSAVAIEPSQTNTIVNVTPAKTLEAPNVEESEEDINTNPLSATARMKDNQIVFDLVLDPRYKAYLDKFELVVIDNKSIKVDSFKISPTITFMDTFSKKEKVGVQDRAEMIAQVQSVDGKPVNESMEFEITYQACTEKHCLFPTKLRVPAQIILAASDTKDVKTLNTSGSMPKPTEQDAFSQALEKGWLFTFFFVFLAGILTSLTPCIFPMIPITLSIIGASALKKDGHHKPSRWKGFSLSVFYVLGIAITYALLGVVAAKTGAMFGAFLANRLVVGAIALVFVAMGLSMYGFFEIQIPSFIRDRLMNTKTDTNYTGAFVSGLIAGVVASPCVGPVLVSVLTFVAQTQKAVLGFALLFTFAIGMGLLFILLGTFSTLANKLPRSGPWMDFTKFVFGTGMIGMALYYLEPVIPDSLFFILFGITLILITSYFGAFEPNEKLTRLTRARKGLMLAGFFMGVLYLGKAIMYQTPFMLPSGLSPSAEQKAKEHGPWVDFTEEKFEAALRSGKPVILDFYADWCVACKELEKFVFSDPAVQREFQKFELLRLDLTVETPENARIREKFNVIGLPTMLFYSKGNPRNDLTLTGYESRGDFLKRLEKAF